jgi:transcriptional regulator with XRE-family HTH domain
MVVREHPGKTLREAVGMSQVAFAEAIGVTQPRVSDVEAGHGNYGRDTILSIMGRFRQQCIQLGITAEDMARGLEDETDALVAPS